MEWREVVGHPSLKDLPFKIETNAEGYIMMAAAKNRHRLYHARISGWLQLHGQEKGSVSECNIQTSDGVKIADVAWGSIEFFKKNRDDDPYQESPEVVIDWKEASFSGNSRDASKSISRRAGLFEEFTMRGESKAPRCSIISQIPILL